MNLQVESWNRANDIFDESTAKVTSSSSKDLNNHDRKFSGSGSLLDFNPPGAQYSQSVSYVVTRLKIKGELSKEQLQRKYGCTIKYTNLHAEKVSGTCVKNLHDNKKGYNAINNGYLNLN